MKSLSGMGSLCRKIYTYIEIQGIHGPPRLYICLQGSRNSKLRISCRGKKPMIEKGSNSVFLALSKWEKHRKWFDCLVLAVPAMPDSRYGKSLVGCSPNQFHLPGHSAQLHVLHPWIPVIRCPSSWLLHIMVTTWDLVWGIPIPIPLNSHHLHIWQTELRCEWAIIYFLQQPLKFWDLIQKLMLITFIN